MQDLMQNPTGTAAPVGFLFGYLRRVERVLLWKGTGLLIGPCTPAISQAWALTCSGWLALRRWCGCIGIGIKKPQRDHESLGSTKQRLTR